MAKYVLTSETQIGTVNYNGDKTEAEVLSMMQQNEPDCNWTDCKKVQRGKHVCGYCGNIANGTDKDLLCDECAKTFGHTRFSEL